jgi:hypothetical protein
MNNTNLSKTKNFKNFNKFNELYSSDTDDTEEIDDTEETDQTKETKETDQTKETKETKEIKETKETKEIKETNEELNIVDVNLSKQSKDKKLYSEKLYLKGNSELYLSESESLSETIIDENKITKSESYYSFLSIENDKNYKEPTIINNISLDKYFHKNDIEISNKNNKKLKITDKGLYTISKYYDAEWISKTIIDFLKSKNIICKEEYIIDATSGIGGNTINFSKYFKHVHSIEINNTHYDILNNNIEALSIFNITTYCDNFFNIINKLIISKNKILFLDPPWGGSSYKNYQYFNLKIGSLTIYEAINKMYDYGYKYIILKAPFNLNISMIYANIKFYNMNVHTNNKKNMLIIIFYV